jgi:hypothetical protein
VEYALVKETDMHKWTMWVMLALAAMLAGCQSSDQPLWRTVLYNDLPPVVEKTHGMPATDFHDAAVIASGTEENAAFVDAVEVATHKTEADALTLLKSFDTTQNHQVQVLELTHDTAVARYWSDPASKIGRWYARSRAYSLLSPADAICQLALPLANKGSCVTQYTVQDGAVVVYGLCADMSGDPVNFSSTATGGGEQFFVPDATLWNAETHTATLNPAVITLDEEVRYVRP